MAGRPFFARDTIILSVQSCLLSLQMRKLFFRDFLDIFLIIYLIDTPICSKTQDEHDIHVRQVLEQLRDYDLYAKLEKCTFHCKPV